MQPMRADLSDGPEALHPVSAGQQALWMLQQLAPESAAYNDAGAARFTPLPDVAALTAAVEIVTQRHDLLRSRFVDDDGMPARMIDTQGPRLEIFDVGDIDDRAMGELLSAAASEPYELAIAGTARFRLYRRADTDAVLLCGNHHIASDAVSQFVLWRDLLTAYGAVCRGESPELPVLDWTWDDQVAAEQRRLAGPLLTRWSEYWRTACRDVPAGELPLDRPRQTRPGLQGATVTAAVPAHLAQTLRGHAMNLGVTPFAMYLATLQAVIHRYSGSGQFLLGCPISLRRSRRMMNSVGYYIAMVLVRGDIRLPQHLRGARAGGRTKNCARRRRRRVCRTRTLSAPSGATPRPARSTASRSPRST